MKNNLKNFLCLIGLGLFCCWLAWDCPTLRVIPARGSSENPVSQQNFHAGNFVPNLDVQLNINKPEHLLAQLPARPTFKTKQLQEPAPDELQPPAVPKNPPHPSPPAQPVKASGLIIEARDYGSNRAGLEKAIAKVRAGGTLHFAPGVWDIDADLTIPAKVMVILDRGALLRVGTQKSRGTLSYANQPCAGTISFSAGSTQVTGKNTDFSKLRPGQIINCAGQRREIRTIANQTHLKVLAPFTKTSSGTDYSKSTYTIKGHGTRFNTELKVGDFIYHGQTKHIITSILGPETLTVLEPPSHNFSGAPFTRSVRVRIDGPLQTGLYQIFSGKGVVSFGPGAITAVHPEWWGARANGGRGFATVNVNAIEKALVPRSGPVELASGSYKINHPLVLQSGNYLLGQGLGWGGTMIGLVKGANCHMVQDAPRKHYQPGGIKDIAFNNNIQDAGYDGIHFVHDTKLWLIEHCSFISSTKHPGGYAIYLNPSGQAWIKGNFIMRFYNGIYACGFDSYFLNNEIGPSGHYAMYLIGDGSVVQGNIMYGDSGCKIGLLSLGTGNSIIGNRIGPFDYGIKMGGGLISGNVLYANRKYGIYSDYFVKDAHITDNKFIKNAGYGLYFHGDWANSLIKNNTFTGNNGGPGNLQIKLAGKVRPNRGFDEPLAEDNVGVDLQCDFPKLPPGSTPNISISRRWQTANTSPTTITDFAGGCRGKEILVIFKDAQTTLKFSGSSRLQGHGGVDWRPVAGDHLRATKGADGFWYCECFSSH
jgi:parallel beta-helix repeat protein